MSMRSAAGSENGSHCLAAKSRCAPAIATAGGALREPGAGLSARGDGTDPAYQMGGTDTVPRGLLYRAVAALGSGTGTAGSGAADRSMEAAGGFFRDRDLAAGSLLYHRPADNRCDRSVFCHQPVWPIVVRFRLSADRVDGSVSVCRT